MDMFLAAWLFSLERTYSISHHCFCLAVSDHELSFDNQFKVWFRQGSEVSMEFTLIRIFIPSKLR